nr:WecB/TagA/CpsF family glycosyltransferase [Ancylobacter gelatini]
MSNNLSPRVFGRASEVPVVNLPPEQTGEHEFLGVKLANLTEKDAAAQIAARPVDAPFAYVVTPNAAHFNRLARLGDKRFNDAYEHAWLRLLDGQIPRALAKIFFGQSIPLATGSDVTLDLLQNHMLPDDAVTIIGSTDELLGGLKERFGLRNVALHVPPRGFVNNETAFAACVDFVLAHPAQYVFFAVGAPQSEYLARAVFARGGAVGTGLCVGSGLLFATGLSRRAPPFFRRNGLEWFYRLMCNPLGHARRIFVESMPIFLIVLRTRFGSDKVSGGKSPLPM